MQLAARHTLLAAAILNLASAELSYAGCPYFTRPSVERDDLAVRTNSYAPGSWVCYQDQMQLCQSSGTWKSMGKCSLYQQVRHACDVEGAGSDECGGNASSGTGLAGNATGSSAGTGGSQSPGGGKGEETSNQSEGSVSGATSSGPDQPGSEHSSFSEPDYGQAPFGDPDGSSSGGSDELLVNPYPPPDTNTTGGSQPYPPASELGQPGSGYPGGTPEFGIPSGVPGEGTCAQREAEILQELQSYYARMDVEEGYCSAAREAERLISLVEPHYYQCPSTDPGGQMRRQLAAIKDQVRKTQTMVCDDSIRPSTAGQSESNFPAPDVGDNVPNGDVPPRYSGRYGDCDGCPSEVRGP